MTAVVATPNASLSSAAGHQIGLALSGEGFGASFFHIGVLARLAELDLLRHVEIISGVGGGAVIGALYYLYLKREIDEQGEVESGRLIEIVADLEQHFLEVVQTNPKWQILADPLGNLRMASMGRAERMGDFLDISLYRPVWNGDRRQPIEMRDLAIHPRGDTAFDPASDNELRHCKVPLLVLGATTLTSGRGWRFDPLRMGEPVAIDGTRHFDTSLALGQASYEQLNLQHCQTPLGRAVAASFANQALARPLTIPGLYRDPARPHDPSPSWCVRLGDGSLYDPLAVEPVRHCGHVIISDGARRRIDGPGQAEDKRTDLAAILMNRIRELQLARLMTAVPDRIAFMHLAADLNAPTATPFGPASTGNISIDRSDDATTSYGVRRQVQRLLCGLRTDVDAFGDTEACALMADGYLMTHKEFSRLQELGAEWAEEEAFTYPYWRFAAVFDSLQNPSGDFIRQLEVARHRHFKAARLRPHILWLQGLCIAALGGLAYAAVQILAFSAWPAPWTILMLAAILPVAAAFSMFVGFEFLLDRAQGPGLMRLVLKLVARGGMAVAALPLALAANVHLVMSRVYLHAARLPIDAFASAPPAIPGSATKEPQDNEDQDTAAA